MKKFSEIDKCKSDIALLEESLKQTTKKISNIDKIKLDITLLEESTKKIPELSQDIVKLKSNRVLLSVFQSKIYELQAQFKTLEDIVVHLGKNDKKRLEETKSWVPMLVSCDKGVENLQTQFKTLENTVNHLGENDVERLKETKTTTGLLVTHNKDISDLKIKINQFSEIDHNINNLKSQFDTMNNIIKMLGKNDVERLKDTKTTTGLLVTHDKDISALKNQIQNLINTFQDATHPQKFSLNAKGKFYPELKKTLYFDPGLILPSKVYVYSLYITTNIKAQAKHKRRFEIIIINNGTPEIIHSFERESYDEIIMEDFNPPLEILPKTKILISCDKKIESVALLTLKY